MFSDTRQSESRRCGSEDFGSGARRKLHDLWSTPRVPHDRVDAAAEQATGDVKDTFGSVTGDIQAEGKIDKAEGRAQSASGEAKETLCSP